MAPVTPLRVEPQLMFTGDASAALDLYTTAFGDAAVESIAKNDDGTILFATFTIAGQRFRCIDSPPVHEFTFTPSLSLAVDCRNSTDVDELAALLGEGGRVLMPVGEYPFSARYTWFDDRFGVSWQIGAGAPTV
jgi:predicted 3-demethylubiquinone-9 3-methyltransferase (glyoxalase superfamily)